MLIREVQSMASVAQPMLLPQIADLKSQFEANVQTAEHLWHGPTAMQLIWQPAPNAWSATECLGHLTITTHEYLNSAGDAIRNAPEGNGPFKADWMGAMLAKNLEPPYRFKVKTAPNFVWKELDAANAMVEFKASQRVLLQALMNANGKALDKVKVRSSFASLIKYNLYSMFLILASHQRRHLWQAEQVLKVATGRT
jgi:hypothetical protein